MHDAAGQVLQVVKGRSVSRLSLVNESLPGRTRPNGIPNLRTEASVSYQRKSTGSDSQGSQGNAHVAES